MKEKEQRYYDYRKEIKARRVKLLGGIAFLCIALIFFVSVGKRLQHLVRKDEAASYVSESPSAKETEAPVAAIPRETAVASPESKDPTERIYTYLQGPKSWNQGLDWSGEWGESYYDGGYFGGFGCGLCCMANIYSTETEYQCSPLDMYRYAKKKTAYLGGMAIEWGYMRRTLTSLGFDCHVAKKPASYKEFAADMEKSLCSIVLVSSADSDVFWKDTSGHYVTVFDYDKEKQKVFLADSGEPKHNRRWLSLKKIYKSLKTASAWQYLVVEDYSKEKDAWRHKGTSGVWNRPSYL